jgi:hypothetical protein
VYTQLICIYFIILDATNYHNIQDDRTVLCERETMAEHVESEEDRDSVSTEPVESPGGHVPLGESNDRILVETNEFNFIFKDHDIYITAPIIVIDLTQDDDGENTGINNFYSFNTKNNSINFSNSSNSTRCCCTSCYD